MFAKPLPLKLSIPLAIEFRQAQNSSRDDTDDHLYQRLSQRFSPKTLLTRGKCIKATLNTPNPPSPCQPLCHKHNIHLPAQQLAPRKSPSPRNPSNLGIPHIRKENAPKISEYGSERQRIMHLEQPRCRMHACANYWGGGAFLRLG
ncbi:hypothetical protein E2P81_ATG02066 [Venturia nashicola]|nr:hypothetical protein E2P81_ATG02066 [Venturia nashicola]